jgi:mono/diheme cytochrome c family protein
MRKRIRSLAALVVILSLSCAASFAAPPGAGTYKSKCQMCHGASGMADTGAGKSMNVRPVSDPEVKKMTEAEMIAVTKNGKEKMPAFKDKLSDAEIKAAVDFYLSLVK